jgi:SPX domain protein involved in polyphosphate accumulation
MDAYSARCEDGFYRVNSLYLDSPDLIFLRTKICGAEKRFNMRIRTYGDNPGLPYFFEIKQKNGDTIRKVRAVIRENDVRENGLEHVMFGPGRAGEDSNMARCRREAITYNVKPWVQTRYLRKAFISHCDDYARVTFDRALEYAPRETFDPIPVAAEMVPSDIGPLFDPETNVILELKCYTAYVPSWMVDLIRHFELRRRGFSKYAAGVMPVVQRFGLDTVDFGRLGGDSF